MLTRRVLRSVVMTGVIGGFLWSVAGCNSANEANVQQVRGNHLNASENRMASGDVYRQHERHATGIESQVADY